MNTRLTCTGAGLWQTLITGLIAMAFACLLSACASSVPVGQPPQTPEQLISMVKRLVDTGRLTDPRAVGRMLGSTIVEAKRSTSNFDADCKRNHVLSATRRYDYLRYEVEAGSWLETYAWPDSPSRYVRSSKPPLMYYINSMQLCAEAKNSEPRREVFLLFTNVSMLPCINEDDVKRNLPKVSISVGTDGAFGFNYVNTDRRTSAYFDFRLFSKCLRVIDVSQSLGPPFPKL